MNRLLSVGEYNQSNQYAQQAVPDCFSAVLQISRCCRRYAILGETMKKYLLSTLLLFISQTVYAGDIGFGSIKGIKVYDFDTSKVTKIYLSDSATNKDITTCEGVGSVTHSSRDADTRKEIIGIALAAYASGKKVRLNSSKGSCEADFIAIQESYF